MGRIVRHRSGDVAVGHEAMKTFEKLRRCEIGKVLRVAMDVSVAKRNRILGFD